MVNYMVAETIGKVELEELIRKWNENRDFFSKRCPHNEIGDPKICIIAPGGKKPLLRRTANRCSAKTWRGRRRCYLRLQERR